MNFMTWWREREANEKLLISVAGLLTALVVLFQFILLPSQSFVERGRVSLANALVEQSDIVAGVAGRVRAEAAPSSTSPLPGVLTGTAELYGIAIARLLPAENGGVNLTLEEVSPSLAYAWLAELERVHSVRVERASIRRQPNATTATVNVFVRRGS